MTPPSRVKAILLNLLVVVIWSSSWILIKIGLRDIPALTFAGLRYFMAFLVLLPFLAQRQIRHQVKDFTKSDWKLIILMGVVSYFLAQGAQFLSLDYLPATTLSLMLNLTSVFVTFTAVFLIKEFPTRLQLVGLMVNLAGIFLFFYPAGFERSSTPGYLFGILCLVANVFGALIGRKVNYQARLNPIAITLVSMGIGSTIMLASGLIWEGIPVLSSQSLLILIVLAVVNTAFTFVLWNYTLQTLTAMESSIINGMMMVFIAILSWIILGETQTLQGVLGLVLAFIGALIVNIRIDRKPRIKK
jgi:drug/metabolite transporter (DMT)-like permease